MYSVYTLVANINMFYKSTWIYIKNICSFALSSCWMKTCRWWFYERVFASVRKMRKMHLNMWLESNFLVEFHDVALPNESYFYTYETFHRPIFFSVVSHRSFCLFLQFTSVGCVIYLAFYFCALNENKYISSTCFRWIRSMWNADERLSYLLNKMYELVINLTLMLI